MAKIIQYTVTKELKLKAAYWYEPHSNVRYPVLIDESRNVMIGFSNKYIYTPETFAACEDVVKSGLVLGSTIYGFECRHAHDLIYMID